VPDTQAPPPPPWWPSAKKKPVPDIPGLFKGIYMDLSTLKTKDKCAKIEWMVIKWNVDRDNIPQFEIFIHCVEIWFSEKELSLKRPDFWQDNRIFRFIPDILVLLIPFYFGIFQAGMFTPPPVLSASSKMTL
jgi:hypothetical protein